MDDNSLVPLRGLVKLRHGAVGGIYGDDKPNAALFEAPPRGASVFLVSPHCLWGVSLSNTLSGHYQAFTPSNPIEVPETEFGHSHRHGRLAGAELPGLVYFVSGRSRNRYDSQPTRIEKVKLTNR